MCDILKTDVAHNQESNDKFELRANIFPIFDMLFEEPSPGPVKYLLTETWEDVGTPLMPITDITPDLSNKLLDYYKKILMYRIFVS